jgi:hypothetical protein
MAATSVNSPPSEQDAWVEKVIEWLGQLVIGDIVHIEIELVIGNFPLFTIGANC